MFIVFLKFADNKAEAGKFMQGHIDWLQKGFDDDVFMMAGSLQPDLGGGILAYNTDLDDLEKRLGEDPFVVEHVVRPEIVELAISKVDARLAFLNP